MALVGNARRKKSARPRWVYESVVSTTSKSPYWDTLGVDGITASLQPEAKSTSDDEDDNVPIVSIVVQEKLNVYVENVADLRRTDPVFRAY